MDVDTITPAVRILRTHACEKELQAKLGQILPINGDGKKFMSEPPFEDDYSTTGSVAMCHSLEVKCCPALRKVF